MTPLKDLNHSALKKRLENTKDLSNTHFDIVIIGAGIHGAMLAWIASIIGKKVLLVEKADYGQGTSSRSSKLLHGGVRYLEQGNVALVYEALKERQAQYNIAPHLSREISFLFHAVKGKTAPAFLVKIGLFAYELFTKGSKSKDENLEDLRKILKESGFKDSDLIKYHDGQVNDVRLCVEAALEAKKLGAKVFNYMQFNSSNFTKEKWSVEIEDLIQNKKIDITSTHLVNLAGASVLDIHKKTNRDWPQDWPQITFSTGVHLYFDTEWPSSGLILPAEKKGRYYFVLPTFSPYKKGVLVGTTDRKVEQGSCFPEPTEDEVNQLMSLLKKDLPELGKLKPYKIISGTRVLAGGGQQSHKLDRKEKILLDDHYATILSGKYTTARATSKKILEQLLGIKISLENLHLSNSKNYKAYNAKDNSDLELEKQAANLRFGNIEFQSNNLENLINSQIEHCIEREDAFYWEDISKRRLNIDDLHDDNSISKAYKKYKVKNIKWLARE